jgi:hypothetical protein
MRVLGCLKPCVVWLLAAPLSSRRGGRSALSLAMRNESKDGSFEAVEVGIASPVNGEVRHHRPIW